MGEINLMKFVNILTFVLTVLGAINWGLYAFDYNLVHMLFGAWPYVEKAIYILVGVSGLYQLIDRFS
ncbi:Uncharacterized conserved protein [Candidatus Babela massiliensis]|uniref:Uncharacterized conserved protein n=2 Tax=Candidatus Babela massiliensis TaxID=673862 RepID=V6DIN0_9BACT|nr:Uncharacterized conserved protein [Candidatus Babela massiliensis]